MSTRDQNRALKPQPRRRHFLIRFVRGDERLWKAYWLVGVLGSWAVSAMVVLLVDAGFLLWQLGIGAAIVYALYATVVIWRCAPNAGWKGWGLIARATLVLSFVLAGIQLTGLV